MYTQDGVRGRHTAQHNTTRHTRIYKRALKHNPSRSHTLVAPQLTKLPLSRSQLPDHSCDKRSERETRMTMMIIIIHNQNCSSSVEPVRAVVDAVPAAMTCASSSK